MKIKLTLFFILVTLGVGIAQDIDKLKLDSLFNALSENNLAMGSLAISKNGAIVYQREFGSALLEKDSVPLDLNTKFRIGSISKMFTAVLVFNLIEEGKLQLTTALHHFYPELPNASKISIRDLLYHRSGLHDYTVDTGFQTWMNKPKTHEELLKIITDKSADFEPGQKSVYGNSNYLILSYILEQIEQKPYKQIVEEGIILKIGLQHTYYGGATDINEHESASYKYAAGKWIREIETDPTIHNGAGSIVSTPTDLIFFIDALFAGKLINSESLKNMTTMIDDYGMGIFPFKFQDKMGYGHGGRIDGFASSLQYYPKDKIAIAYCTNGIVYPKDDIMDGILHICFNTPYMLPKFSHIDIKAESLNHYAGTYTSSTMPIKITCTVKNGSLIAETKGQPFIIKPIGNDKFSNIEYGFFFEFDGDRLVLKEGDNVYYLEKE